MVTKWPATSTWCASVVACCLVAACNGDRGSAALPAPVTGAPVSMAAAARLSVGVIEGDSLQEFDRVVTPFLLPDGRLVVPLAGAGAIRVFGPTGAFVETLGRSGEGPGEFGSLSQAWPRGDTIEAFDSRLSRITQFLPDGSTDVVALERVRSAEIAVPGALADGWLLMGVAHVAEDGRDRIAAHRYACDGAHLGEIARIDGFLRYTFPGGRAPHPLSPRSVMAVARGELYMAETLTASIHVLNPAGDTVREISWQPPSSPAPGAMLRRVIDTAVARSAADGADRTRQRLEAAAIPEHVSAFWDFMVDDEGFIWIRPYEPVRDAAALGGLSGRGVPGWTHDVRWDIITRDGAAAGHIMVPAGLEPMQITADAVVGIHRDEFGVESVRVHDLSRHRASEETS
jgi:hypothetical protein